MFEKFENVLQLEYMPYKKTNILFAMFSHIIFE